MKKMSPNRYDFRLIFLIIQLTFLFFKIIDSRSVSGWQGSPVRWNFLPEFHATPPYTAEPLSVSLYTFSSVAHRLSPLYLLPRMFPTPSSFGNSQGQSLFPSIITDKTIATFTSGLNPSHSIP